MPEAKATGEPRLGKKAFRLAKASLVLVFVVRSPGQDFDRALPADPPPSAVKIQRDAGPDEGFAQGFSLAEDDLPAFGLEGHPRGHFISPFSGRDTNGSVFAT
jgi:hypothetical protein